MLPDDYARLEDGESPEEAVRRELSEELLLSREQIELHEETSLLVNELLP